MDRSTPLPKVSVIISTYNRPHLIARAVLSALGQTYGNMEIVVVDADPTGKTAEALAPLVKKHPNVVDFVFKQMPPTGTLKDLRNIARNRNAGIRIAKGDYIAPLDDDDTWPDPRKIERQVEFFESHPDYSIVFGNLSGTNEDDNNKEEIAYFPADDKEIRKYALMPGGIMTSTVMYRKSDWEKVGGYDETVVLESLDFHLTLGMIGKMKCLPYLFVHYAMGENKYAHAPAYGRACLRNGLVTIWKFRGYPGFVKAFLFQLMYFLYAFVPYRIRTGMRPFARKIQTVLLARFSGVDRKIFQRSERE